MTCQIVDTSSLFKCFFKTLTDSRLKAPMNKNNIQIIDDERKNGKKDKNLLKSYN